MNIKINKKIIAFLMCYILCVSFLPTCAFAESNSVENEVINNGSLLVKEGDWLYYRNSHDGGSIYKVKTDGTKNTKINDISSCDITINGDWIYFRSLAPKDKYYELFRIRKDGTGLKDLNVQCYEISVTDKYVYYLPGIDRYDNNAGLCKMKKDGTNKTIFIEKSESDDPDIFQGIIKNYFLFHEHLWLLNNEKVIDLKETIPKNIQYRVIKRITKNKIYFDDWSHILYRVNYDGSKIEQIKQDIDATNYESFNDSIINDDWIYNDYTQNIRMINSNKKINLSKLGKYVDEFSIRIKRIIGNWIYYYDYNYNGLYRIKTDGTNKMLIYKIKNHDYIYEFQNYLVSGNDIYYIVEGRKSEMNLFKYDGKNKTHKMLVNEDISEVNEEKVWRVNFNKRLDETTVNKENIIVTNGDNVPVDVNINLSSDKKSIYINSNMYYDEKWGIYRDMDKLLYPLEKKNSSSEDYNLRGKEIYNIKITTNVKDESGNKLKKQVVKKFKIKDNTDYEN